MRLTLGEKLKDMRIKRKMTSKQVCNEIKKQYGYSLSEGKYNEMENDIDKDFGYRAFIYLAKFYNVSSDYLLGLTKEPTIEPDIKIACEVTGLSEQSIIKISEFDKKSKESLNRLISFNRIEEILEFSEHILFEK